MSTASEILNNSNDLTIGGVDVNIQSQTSNLFQYYLTDEQKTDITLTSAVSPGDEVINVSSGHGFTGASGEVLVIRIADQFEQVGVVSVATDAITVDIPIAKTYTVDDTTVVRGNINMNVDGSSTQVLFEYTNDSSLGASVPVDISKVAITIQHGSNVPDDGKFAGITALTKGLYFRKFNGVINNLGNYTKNSDFREVGGIITYSDKAPAGTNGTNIIFDIEGIFGQVIRLDPNVSDVLCAVVRDDLSASAGISGMTISLIGSFTRGE